MKHMVPKDSEGVVRALSQFRKNEKHEAENHWEDGYLYIAIPPDKDPEEYRQQWINGLDQNLRRLNRDYGVDKDHTVIEDRGHGRKTLRVAYFLYNEHAIETIASMVGAITSQEFESVERYIAADKDMSVFARRKTVEENAERIIAESFAEHDLFLNGQIIERLPEGAGLGEAEEAHSVPPPAMRPRTHRQIVRCGIMSAGLEEVNRKGGSSRI